MPHLELIDDEYLGVTFQYDRSIVQQLRRLNARRWNPEKRRWEVHIVHLAEIMKIFHLRPDDVPSEIVSRYQNQWIKAKIGIRVANCFTQTDGGQLPMEKIDDVTSFPVYGHHFNLMFLDGKWDGRKHLFDRRNFTFPTGLLDRVLDTLRREGMGFEIEDRRDPLEEPPPPPEVKDDRIPHVHEALEAMVTARRGLLELAPGSGKWDLIAHIVRLFESDIVLITSGRSSLVRTLSELRQRLDEPIGQAGGDRVALERFTVVSTPVACSAFGIRLGKTHAGEDPIQDDLDIAEFQRDLSIRIREVPILLFDDVHTVPADTCYQIAMRCQAAGWRFGFSATPHRADGHDMLLEAAFGPFIHHTEISTLIETQLAVPAHVTFVQPQRYPACERDREPEEIFERAILTNEARHALAAERAIALAMEKRRVVVLANDTDHANQILKHIPDGVLIEGTGDEEERSTVDSILASKRSRVILVTPTTGDSILDDPRITGLLFAVPGASETKALERICRCLSPAKGKKNVHIVDLFDPLPYLKEKALKRIEILRTQRAITVETEGF